MLDYKVIQAIFGVSRDFFKYFKDQITDMLIIHLIFACDIKALCLFTSLIFYKLQK